LRFKGGQTFCEPAPNSLDDDDSQIGQYTDCTPLAVSSQQQRNMLHMSRFDGAANGATTTLATEKYKSGAKNSV
jgi:hypothetical protein